MKLFSKKQQKKASVVTCIRKHLKGPARDQYTIPLLEMSTEAGNKARPLERMLCLLCANQLPTINLLPGLLWKSFRMWHKESWNPCLVRYTYGFLTHRHPSLYLPVLLEAGKQMISLADCHLQFIKKLRSVGLYAEYVCKAQGEGAWCAGDA